MSIGLEEANLLSFEVSTDGGSEFVVGVLGLCEGVKEFNKHILCCFVNKKNKINIPMIRLRMNRSFLIRVPRVSGFDRSISIKITGCWVSSFFCLLSGNAIGANFKFIHVEKKWVNPSSIHFSPSWLFYED